MSSGIYKITNLVNGKVYIGQSVNIKLRFNKHKTEPFNKTSLEYDKMLYNAIRKYGLENFQFEIIEECEIEKLNEREQYYVSQFNSHNREFGYNLTTGGDGGRFLSSSPQELEEITFLLQEGVKTNREIAEFYDLSEQHICNINVGRTWFRENLKYPLRPTKKHYCKNCGSEISLGAILCVECAGKSKRVVERPSKEILLEEVATLGFEGTGRKYGISGNSIKKWCISYGLPSKIKDIKNLYIK